MSQNLHVMTEGLVSILATQGRELAPHLKAALDRLSSEHPSGIALAQLETPMMKQFCAAKEEVPDALLFFRMGDFFELFGADAILASDVCGLTLTSRDKNSDNPVPMAGIPAVAYRAALRKCVHAGFKVAVCDQTEDPRQAKSIVKREIVRIATPAVPGDLGDDAVDEELGCYLAAVVPGKKGWTLAYVDVSTGDFRLTGNLEESLLQQEILTVAPREILAPAASAEMLQAFLRNSFQSIPRLTVIDAWVLRAEKNCQEVFREFFAESDQHRFGVSHYENGLQAVAAILAYLKNTQRGILKNVKQVQSYEATKHLLIDDATRKHLDFFQTASGERKGSFFQFLNRCATAAGSRALVRRLNYPFKEQEQIKNSQECISELASAPIFFQNVTDKLRLCADLDRIVARTAQGSIDPKGLAWLRETLIQIPKIIQLISEQSHGSFLNTFAQNYAPEFLVSEQLSALLCAALEAEPAALLGKGGRVFKQGFSAELDEVLQLETNFDELIEKLEQSEREKTGISTLKIGFTRVFGYYFEISKGKLANTPAHFIRKQTLTNGERFITAELKELEERALSANERRGILERELFELLRGDVLKYAQPMARVSEFLGQLDLLRTFSEMATTFSWCRPQIVGSNVTVLKNNVHPILKYMHGGSEPFMPNSIAVGDTSTLPADHFVHSLTATSADARVLLITGPNMAGKSTLMRQVALAQVLFQMGSFVPATEACMGVCDRIFTRIGSADFALRQQSTFMVEMLETSFMLRYATAQSMLLMDEVGRGTSTYDGLSLAWAILEDLHDRVHARTLFSTHYHELQMATVNRPCIAPMQMEVIEREKRMPDGQKKWEIYFSRKFMHGAAGKSYGLHVAELAGLDANVIARAGTILASLGGALSPDTSSSLQSEPPHASEHAAQTSASHAQASPNHSPTSASSAQADAMAVLVEGLDPDALSPREAHAFLYSLKEMMLGGTPQKNTRKGARKADALRASVGNSIFE